MTQGTDPGPIVPWVEIIITAVGAGVSGFFVAIVMAFRSAWGLSKQLQVMEAKFIAAVTELRLHVDANDSKRFHDLINIMQTEVGKCEAADDSLSQRIGATEQEIAVLRDFKTRMERERVVT